MRRTMLGLALAVAIAGCEEKKAPEKGTPPPKNEGSASMPKPNKDPGKTAGTETPKVVRKVVDPSKKGQVATYLCECQDKEWTQPAEEEKLCIDYCNGDMPSCGKLVKIEPAK